VNGSVLAFWLVGVALLVEGAVSFDVEVVGVPASLDGEVPVPVSLDGEVPVLGLLGSCFP
jgi:hypothetical protein